MKYFIPELTNKNIVMISDYVNPDTYTKKEWNDESKFLDIVRKEIEHYDMRFFYSEIKNLKELKETLNRFDKDKIVVFNWCEYLNETEDTAHLVTEYLEKERYIFTGSGTQCLQLTSSKQKTKETLMNHHLPTPNYHIITKDFPNIELSLKYPLMLKLENRHASTGITNENVVYNKQQLTQVAQKLISKYQSDILVEEFISGHEYTATVWGNHLDAACIYVTKETYKDQSISNISTEIGKFVTGSQEENNIVSVPVDINKDKDIFEKVGNLSVNSFRALNFFDYGRFELREENGNFFIIDCNPNQWIGLDAVLFQGTKKLKYNYGETLLQICEFAVKRYMQ